MRSSGSVILISALWGALTAAAACAGAEVEISLGSSLAWIDTPVTLEVKISNPERGMGAPRISPVAGLEIRGPMGPQARSIIQNGRSSVYVTYVYQLTPLRGKTGKFTIGPVSVPRQGGSPLQSGTVELLVSRRPEPGVLMECAVLPETGPIGAPFRVVYTILYSGDAGDGDDDGFGSFFSRGSNLGLTGLDLPILQLSSVKLKPIRVKEGEEASTVRIGNQAEIYTQHGFSEKEGFGYLTVIFGFEVTPFTTGAVRVGGATATLRLKTGKTTVARSIFGEPVRVPEVKDFKASCPEATYQVRPLPEEGRPSGFTGAVGRFAVAVKASPTEVDAFAPIALEVRVTGQGFLEDLKPAAWTEVESLTRDFDVSTDVDSGKVDGSAKVFRQVIRPRSEKVKSIPALPFPFFDPALGKYQVALSQPIPITVRAVKTVGGDEAIRAPTATEPALRSQPAPVVPSIVEKAGIGANFDAIGDTRAALDPREEVLSGPFLAVIACPPALIALLAVLRKLRHKDPAMKRRAQALARALSVLSSESSAPSTAAACEGYFRERLDLPPGEVTPGDVAEALTRRGLPDPLRRSASDLLERVHASRFGGARETANELASQAARVLREVDKCLRA